MSGKPLPLSKVLERLSTRGFTLLGEYVNNESRSMLRCSHGHEWLADIGNVLKKNGTGCPHCAGMARLTLDEIDKRLEGRGIRRLCDNTKSAKKSIFQCDCGHVWSVRLGGLMIQKSNGKMAGCPKCRSNRPLTVDEVNSRVSHRGYKVVGDFKNAGTHTVFACCEGHRWSALPDNILRGRGCPHCAGLVKMSKDDVNARIAHKGIRVVSDVKNVLADATFECSCGHRWVTKPASVIHTSGCPACADYGFDSSKPAYFYAMRIYSDSSEYVGYGVTRNVYLRLSVHSRELRKKGYWWDLQDLLYFEKGGDALALERTIKRKFASANIGIPGFKREATVIDNYPAVFSTLMEADACAC